MSTLEDFASTIGPTANLSSLILASLWTINNGFDKNSKWSLTLAQYSITKSALDLHNDLLGEILKDAMSHAGGLDKVYFLDGQHSYRNFKRRADFETRWRDKEIFLRLNPNRKQAIWLLDSLEAYKQLEKDLLNIRKHYQRNGFFVILYTGKEAAPLKTIELIFRRLLTIFVTNISVLLSVNETISVYTFYPFTPNSCGSTKPVHLFSFSGSKKATDFFPRKTKNMYGCPIMVTARQLLPWTGWSDLENTDSVELTGIEGALLMLLAKNMNATIRLVLNPYPEIGQVYPNGTSTGVFRLLSEGKSNITAGSHIYDMIRSRYFQATLSHMSSEILMCIPAGNPIGPYVRLVRPFQHIVWACLAANLLFGAFLIYVLKITRKGAVAWFIFGRHNRTPLTNMFITFYGGPVHGRLPGRNFSRFLLTLWLLYAFVLRNAYTGELFVLLQDGRRSTMLQTIDELISNDYTIYSPASMAQPLINTYQSVKVEPLNTVNITQFEIIERLQRESSRIALTMTEQMVRYNNRKRPKHTEPIKVLPEKILTSPLTMFMPPHSYFRRRINELLLGLISGGIIGKFEHLFTDKDTDRIEEPQVPSKLSVGVLSGVFSIHLLLLFCCTLIFLFELCSAKSIIVKTCIDFLYV